MALGFNSGLVDIVGLVLSGAMWCLKITMLYTRYEKYHWLLDDNGARVNVSDCSYTADVGIAELKTVWVDPDYAPDQRAFYYARVLENPTCRWSTWDAVRAGVPPRIGIKATIQERAWSSPIWIVPT